LDQHLAIHRRVIRGGGQRDSAVGGALDPRKRALCANSAGLRSYRLLRATSDHGTERRLGNTLAGRSRAVVELGVLGSNSRDSRHGGRSARVTVDFQGIAPVPSPGPADAAPPAMEAAGDRIENAARADGFSQSRRRIAKPVFLRSGRRRQGQEGTSASAHCSKKAHDTSPRTGRQSRGGQPGGPQTLAYGAMPSILAEGQRPPHPKVSQKKKLLQSARGRRGRGARSNPSPDRW